MILLVLRARIRQGYNNSKRRFRLTVRTRPVHNVAVPSFSISATSTGSAHFSYDTQNRRVWQWNGAVDQNNNPVSYSIYYYGANGKRLVAYTVTLSQVLTNGHISGYNLNSSVVLQDTYFGNRRLAPMDRIGSAADVGA